MIILKMDKVPENYIKTTITINEQKYTVYKLKGSSKLLLYGLNIATGEKNYYTYDKTEKTLQIFDIKEYNKNLNDIKTNSYIIIGLSSLVLLLFIMVILFASKSNKLKKLAGLKNIKKSD